MTPHGEPRNPAALSRECFPAYTLITVHGELDFASVPEIRERLYAALRDPGPLVVIELSGVTFCDASGLAMLIGARRRAERLGAAISLAAPRPQVESLLGVTGLGRAFDVHHSVVEAIRLAPRGARSAAA